MATLNYADLLDEVSENVLTITFEGGDLNFRQLDALSGQQLKAMLALVDIVQDEKVSTEVRIDTMIQILINASDDKEMAKDVFTDMPLKIVNKIFTEWSGGEEQGNS